MLGFLQNTQQWLPGITPTSILDKTDLQNAWQLPELVPPDEIYEPTPMETDEEAEIIHIQSDAQLYSVKEQTIDGSTKTYSILKIMSEVPDSMLDKSNMKQQDRAKSTFNLFMGDVSGSMSCFWPSVVQSWNTHIKPNLTGRTSIMTFGSDVTTKRSGYTSDCYEIKQNDFDGTCTDLTGALQAIVEEVYKCKEKFINVYFVTDGGHNQTRCQPGDAIEKMIAPEGKICNIFVLGAGNGFPVQYSVSIRSRLHNGSTNIPTIFWAKDSCSNDMDQQMKDVAQCLGRSASGDTVKISIPGEILPFNSSQCNFHLNEYVYFDRAPEDLEDIIFEFGKYKGKMHLVAKNADVDLYLNNVFRQWNGILIQIHNKKEKISPEIVPFMERLFSSTINEIQIKTESTIQSRLASKELRGYKATFQTLMTTIKNILTNEHFSSEIELAENILSTTVTSNKYAEKTLRMKGHTTQEYDKDMEIFRKVIVQEKSKLMKIDVTTEDCCSVTMNSTISDLKDEDLNDLLELNKYDFLKTFTISGIPIYSPLRDSAMINPWIYSIQRVLKSPYNVVSQVVLETMSVASPNSVDEQNKGVTLQGNEEDTCFNAIIPVFSPNVASHMKNIMKTKVYAMCCTFAILKNPHIIDYNVHMAALAIVWVRMLYEHPIHPRPEYLDYRIKCIESTASQYFDRPSFVKYLNLLKDNTAQAIMTESTVEIDGSTLKCESLIKPMFFLHMAIQAKQITDQTTIKNIVKTILIEYIGRCLSSSLKNNKNPDKMITYSSFFTDNSMKQANGSMNMNMFIEEIKSKLCENASNLLEVFYFKEQLKKSAKKAANDIIERQHTELTSDITIKLNTSKINCLRNVSACGDVSLASLKTFAKEVGLLDNDVEDLFSEENMFLYVSQGFKYTNSRERLESPLQDYDTCFGATTKMVKNEVSKEKIKNLFEKLVMEMENDWLSCYTKAHADVVEPMSKSQIIQEANNKDIIVNEESFDQVYKRYRPSVGLMGNACQSRNCPWFLKPMKQYNEHAATERCGDAFPHGLHITLKQHCTEDITNISNRIVAGENTRSAIETTHEKLSDLDLVHLKNLYIQSATKKDTKEIPHNFNISLKRHCTTDIRTVAVWLSAS